MEDMEDMRTRIGRRSFRGSEAEVERSPGSSGFGGSALLPWFGGRCPPLEASAELMRASRVLEAEGFGCRTPGFGFRGAWISGLGSSREQDPQLWGPKGSVLPTGEAQSALRSTSTLMDGEARNPNRTSANSNCQPQLPTSIQTPNPLTSKPIIHLVATPVLTFRATFLQELRVRNMLLWASRFRLRRGAVVQRERHLTPWTGLQGAGELGLRVQALGFRLQGLGFRV